MTNKLTFSEVKEKYLKMLRQYVPIVQRVHGGTHPEFHEVRTLFDAISGKIESTGSRKPELDVEFADLRAVTGNYTVPGDVCESYAAVYNMLAALDKAYHSYANTV
jgi:regulator of cell morphogenesis and NO signaling